MKLRSISLIAIVLSLACCNNTPTQTANDVKTGAELTVDAITCLEQLPDGTTPKVAIGVCLPKVALEDAGDLIDLVGQLFEQKHLAMKAEPTFAFHKPASKDGGI